MLLLSIFVFDYRCNEYCLLRFRTVVPGEQLAFIKMWFYTLCKGKAGRWAFLFLSLFLF